MEAVQAGNGVNFRRAAIFVCRINDQRSTGVVVFVKGKSEIMKLKLLFFTFPYGRGRSQ